MLMGKNLLSCLALLGIVHLRFVMGGCGGPDAPCPTDPETTVAPATAASSGISFSNLLLLIGSRRNNNNNYGYSRFDACIPGCGPNGRCIPGSNSCACSPGYVESRTQSNSLGRCVIDRCFLPGTRRSLCSPRARCVGNDEGFGCVCNAGFQGNGVTCRPIDSCFSRCSRLAFCWNIGRNGGYRYNCVCYGGFRGNGISCYRTQSYQG